MSSSSSPNYHFYSVFNDDFHDTKPISGYMNVPHLAIPHPPRFKRDSTQGSTTGLIVAYIPFNFTYASSNVQVPQVGVDITSLDGGSPAPASSSSAAAAPSSTTKADSGKSGLGGGAIAGIAVGAVVAIAILVALIAFCLLRRRRNKRNEQGLQAVKGGLASKDMDSGHEMSSYQRIGHMPTAGAALGGSAGATEAGTAVPVGRHAPHERVGGASRASYADTVGAERSRNLQIDTSRGRETAPRLSGVGSVEHGGVSPVDEKVEGYTETARDVSPVSEHNFER